MVTIVDPQLQVEAVPDHPGNRRLIVSYTIAVPAGDPAIGDWVLEEATVHARDCHDAPVPPTDLSVKMEGRTHVDQAGPIPRRIATDVHRVDLDVEQDWWRTDHAGGVEPIAEFVDHLVAEVALRLDADVLATAETPMITGSWGALGRD
ncbi:MAG: hypothetical protein OEM97_03195 [Acidimicrobiia bacterium]|nr:hypothetical protein [Acidimicrobiia bacterium]